MPSSPFRVLAVDDEVSILGLYRQILTRNQLSRRSSTNGRVFELTLCQQADEAVDAVRAGIKDGNPFSLVFLDFYMPPGADGVWAAEEMRKIDSEVGIAIVTGHINIELLELARRIPPPDKLLFLQKPFSAVEIMQFASSMCAKWRSEKELKAIQADLETLVHKRTAALMETNQKLTKQIVGRKQAEKALDSSEENYRNMIARNADAIIITDANQIVRFANSAAEALFGMPSDRLIGNSFGYPLLPGKTMEMDIVRDDASSLVAEVRTADTEWERKPASLASFRDITEHNRVKDELRERMKELRDAMRGTIRAMATAVEMRDPYTSGHQQRVAELSHRIGAELKCAPDQMEGLRLAALIHDIGKISVPAEILSKPCQLSELEYRMITPHAKSGYHILQPIKFPWPIAEIVFQHHERWDGSGYPRGLSGHDILLEARIIGVADVVEAMAFHRPYRPALGIDKALEEISGKRGILYDPDVVDVCMKLFREKGYVFPL